MKKIQLFSFCNLYIILWLVYSLQATVFIDVGTVYSQAIILFLTVVSLYYMAYTLIHYKISLFMKMLTVFVVLLTIYGIALIVGSDTYTTHRLERVSNYTYLLSLYSSLLPIYPFYVFTRQGYLTHISLRWWTIVFLVAVLLQYNENRQAALLNAVMLGSDREEFTNNVGYEFLAVMPLMAFFSEKRVIQYAGLAYIMVFILLAMKRGAILIGAVCFVYFIWRSMRGASDNRKFIVAILSVAVIVLGYFVIQNLLENSDYFQYRLELTQEGESSGRDEIYSTLYNHFINETSPLKFLFGNGAYGTLKVSHRLAHNDWLELAINQGLLGIVVYVFYWISFLKIIHRARFNDELHMAITLLFIIFLLRTFFSMSYGDMSIYATCCLGYCLAKINEHEFIIKNNYIIT